MKALVYHGPGKKSWEEKPNPVLQQPTDAIVRIYKTTICGTDLHILKGDVPEVTDGRILGHEGIGIIEEVGSAVTTFQKGDKVLISCITSCGKCSYCRKGMYSHCDQGGWILGHTIDGTQAEYVRIPFADTSLYPIPVQADDDAVVMLSDILPTGFECGVLNGQVQPGDTVVIVGVGPIGLAVLLTAQFYAPAMIIAIDVDDNRLQVAKTLGATHSINSQEKDAVKEVFSLTNVGVHGKPVELHLETLWSRNITITTRLVDTVTTPMLMKNVISNKLDGKKLITHHFALSDIIQAYDTFEHAAREKALKVILTSE